MIQYWYTLAPGSGIPQAHMNERVANSQFFNNFCQFLITFILSDLGMEHKTGPKQIG